MVPGPRQVRPNDNITVILHRPSVPENIGSTARAMKNTGFSSLILSCPETEDWSTAGNLAVSASDILNRAPRCASLEEAISMSGARFLIGTTARGRKYWRSADVGDAAPVIMERARAGGAALLFGPENTGLTNQELALCHTTITIPAEGELASYNLAQAVLLVLYTLMLCDAPGAGPALPEPASFAEMEGMYSHLRELLTEAGFLREDNAEHMMRAVRKFVNRTTPAESEVRMIRGVCRRLLHHLRNPGLGDGQKG